MYYTTTIFNQLLNFLPKHKFNQFVGQHNSDKYTKRLTTWNQLVALLYAQATGKDSLRDIETGFNLNKNVWYHLGVASVARSSLADANCRRPHQIFEKLFYSLLERFHKVIPNENKFDFENPLYSFDSTTIQLCLTVFDWAKFRTAKGALKIHTLLNNRTTVPELINMTVGNVADITALKKIDLNLPKQSILVFDRGYIDYDLWAKIQQKQWFFVSRSKITQNLMVIGQHNAANVLELNILADEKVIYGDYQSMQKHPDMILRRIKYYHAIDKKEYIYLTNNFQLSALQIADIYKRRWQIEIFFKWIKQNLKIKTFLGTSENAVLTQIWIAMIYYLLASYIKFQTKFNKSLLELTRMIKETLLMRRDLIDLLSLGEKTVIKLKKIDDNPQMSFW